MEQLDDARCPHRRVVTQWLFQPLHLTGVVRMQSVIDREQPKPPSARGLQVEPAVSVGRQLANHSGAADVVQLGYFFGVDFTTPTDRDHTELLRFVLRQIDQITYELAIALLEHMQLQRQSRIHHCPQREQRETLWHLSTVGRSFTMRSTESQTVATPRLGEVIRRIDLRGRRHDLDYRALVPRAATDIETALDVVRPICDHVRDHGGAALLQLSERFDGVTITDIAVPKEALERAAADLEPPVREALEESIRRARHVHADQRRRDTTTQVVPGGTVTERWVPVRRVGLYVPGGRAVYPSSVIMNVVPAQTAGVGSLAVASPPQKEYGGLPHPSILAACALLGIDEVYAVGGAQAIAMFAYGAGSCQSVDLVTGPGNIYVTAAKRLLKGRIGIDAEAGPTEIAILADRTATATHVAADLISQAEHDPMAASVLVTDSTELADAVVKELEAQVAVTKHVERIQAALSGQQSAIVLVDDIDQGLDVVDAYAAEHLEIQTADAETIAARVHNAGAIFIGPYAPVSLGDYCAGSNHVLPTGGCARHSSGLSVQSFLRGIHVVNYDEVALREVANHVITLADTEDLPAHGAAITARFPEHGA
jgi:histidinol dehydrogenase